jgi:hypothetical protein
MPVECYQISDYEREGASVIAVTTYSMRPPETNLLDVLQLVAPSARLLGNAGSVFDPAYRYAVPDAAIPDALALLESHKAPVVTAMTACSISVCLDFYQHPEEIDETVAWKKTTIGDLVYGAKYGGRLKQYGPQLAELVTRYVTEHPVLRTAAAVSATPSSQSLGVAQRGLVAGSPTGSRANWRSRSYR